MEKVTGEQLITMLETGSAIVSDDKKYILSKSSNEKLAERIANADGVGYFKAYGDENLSKGGTVEVCLKWKWDEKNEIEICLKWGYEN
jgi:hypothetical protein